jgi:F-type H+-transporting ATPase subunit delta
MKAASRGVARRYARAMLEVAQAGGTARELRVELEQAAAALAAHAPLQRALLHPALNPERKRALLAAVFAQGSELLRRSVDLVASRGRLLLLPAIAEEYALALLRSEGIEPAEAVTAQPLSAAQATAIQAALRAATGKQIELRTSVDGALLGGVLVRIAGRHYDGSVAGRLAELRRRLQAA